MNNFKKISSLVAALLGLSFAVSASATTYTYSFGTRIGDISSTNYGPTNLGGDVATADLYAASPVTLTFNDADNTFTLSQLFDWKGATIAALAVNYNDGQPNIPSSIAPVAAIMTSSTSTDPRPENRLVEGIKVEGTNGPYGSGDPFTWFFGNNPDNLDKLTRGDSVSWTANDLNPLWLPSPGGLNNFALQVFRTSPLVDKEGFDTDFVKYPDIQSWYGASSVVTAVPEPETYALMLAGLTIVGFGSRRRNCK